MATWRLLLCCCADTPSGFEPAARLRPGALAVGSRMLRLCAVRAWKSSRLNACHARHQRWRTRVARLWRSLDVPEGQGPEKCRPVTAASLPNSDGGAASCQSVHDGTRTLRNHYALNMTYGTIFREILRFGKWTGSGRGIDRSICSIRCALGQIAEGCHLQAKVLDADMCRALGKRGAKVSPIVGAKRSPAVTAITPRPALSPNIGNVERVEGPMRTILISIVLMVPLLSGIASVVTADSINVTPITPIAASY